MKCLYLIKHFWSLTSGKSSNKDLYLSKYFMVKKKLFYIIMRNSLNNGLN